MDKYLQAVEDAASKYETYVKEVLSQYSDDDVLPDEVAQKALSLQDDIKAKAIEAAEAYKKR